MAAISIDSMCAGLGHWQIAISDGTSVVTFATEWAAIQQPLEPDEYEQLAKLVLRAKYAGVPLHELGDLLLNGVTI